MVSPHTGNLAWRLIHTCAPQYAHTSHHVCTPQAVPAILYCLKEPAVHSPYVRETPPAQLLMSHSLYPKNTKPRVASIEWGLPGVP